MKDGLTKAETVALWHAVSNFDYMIRVMPSVEGVTAEQVLLEKERLTTARRALRKINELRKQGL
jgi:hypothetical protein